MSTAKLAVVVLAGLVLHVCLFARFSYEGARPDVVILLAIAAGFVGGPEKGALVGFAAGVSLDALLSTPMGLSALVYIVVGYVVGRASAGVLRSAWWIVSAVAAMASAAGMIAYALVGTVLGQATLDGPALWAILVIVPAVNAVLAPAAVRAMGWARHDERVKPRYGAPRLGRA